jgi:hypothetical protein
MSPFLDITGQKFGRLTALYRSPEKKRNRSVWVCECECGSLASVNTDMLLDGKIVGCGCKSNRVHWLRGTQEPGVPAGYRQYRSLYLRNARVRGLEWQLTERETFDFFSGDCHYCGQSPSMVNRSRPNSKPRNGIDRINSNIGYIKSNCVSCCGQCNMLKRDMSYDDFAGWIKRVYEYMNG